ncbi:histidine kinase 5 [Prunus dulcis]|uniref:Histidine kinase 5 n=1 Tax=Prunus dulcis TaxID=3755 RepID=A0A4Y1RJW9_PRUDU|nr:histidine kinase 5 [Prunus dulcis]
MTYWTKVGFRDSVEDKELLYLFIYNHFPSLQEEHIIGRTDVEIFTGAGVKESQDFKEVLEKQARKRKKMAKLSEEIAVQKAKELIMNSKT